jgi:hypothetical protein
MRGLWLALALAAWSGVAVAQGLPVRETGSAEGATPSRDDDGRPDHPVPPVGRRGPGKWPEGTPICNDCVTNSGSTATTASLALTVSSLTLKVSLAEKSSLTTITGITAVIDSGTKTHSLTGLSNTLSQTKIYGSASLGVFGTKASWTTGTKVRVTVNYKVGSTTKPALVFEITPTFK